MSGQLYAELSQYRDFDLNNLGDAGFLDFLQKLQEGFASVPACQNLAKDLAPDALVIISKKLELTQKALRKLQEATRIVAEISSADFPRGQLGAKILELGSLQNEALDYLYGEED